MHLRSLSLTPILLLASLSLFWGLNWPGMKIILSEMTVWWFRGLCLVIGGGILLLVSALSGKRWKLHRHELAPVLTCASFAVLGWMLFSAYGVSLMVPIIGVYSGYLILDEQVGVSELLALLLILIAFVLVLLFPAWQTSRRAGTA